MDPLAVKSAVDELTAQTLPELIAGLNAALDRLDALLDRLDGATLTLRVPPKHPNA